MSEQAFVHLPLRGLDGALVHFGSLKGICMSSLDGWGWFLHPSLCVESVCLSFVYLCSPLGR